MTPAFTQLLADKPKLHFWAGDWQLGGLNDKLMNALWKSIRERWPDGGFHSLETGAGLSTLLLLCAQPAAHVAVAPDAALGERIAQQVQARGLDAGAFRFVAERSETFLPRLAAEREPYLDFALIDGGHGWPTVFVDFCYVNALLKRGGLLWLDDTQLHSVRELALLLRSQPEFAVAGNHGKIVAFEKKTDARFLPDFGGEPYILKNSLG